MTKLAAEPPTTKAPTAETSTTAAVTKGVSLSRRFYTRTAIVVICIMLISVIVVDYAYVKKLEFSAQEKLRLHIYSLLSVAVFEDGELTVPTILYNPRFNQYESGLWATVLSENKEIIWHTLSIHKPEISIALSTEAGQWKFDKQGFDKKTYLVATFNSAWEDRGQYHTYHIVVAEDKAVIDSDINQFRILLLSGFCFITLSLLVAQHLVLKMAFRPITKLEQEIILLEQGKQNALSSDYPKELNGVTKNLNELVEKEHQQRQRYRESMADLAHSLKTPIAILNNELEYYPQNKTMQNALARIDNSIEYQLRRAVISGHTLLSHGTEVRSVVQLVIDAMENIYREKSILAKVSVDEGMRFYGDENDLVEVLGNLLDNAYKYASRHVQVTAVRENSRGYMQENSDTNEALSSSLNIIIEDDGPGFSEAEGSRIFFRGERLDQKGLGQGIGLSVVHDIVKSYKGTIDAMQSKLGGAKFHIIFIK